MYDAIKGKRHYLPENRVKYYMYQLIKSIDHMHRNGIFHRDIKPENLVFDEDGYLRITDLGIARVWNPENGKDTSGTPGYMAPELFLQ